MFLDERTPAERLCLCLLPRELKDMKDKGNKDLQLNACRVQLQWLTLTHSQPASLLWNIMCLCPLSVSCGSPKASRVFISVFCLQIVLANFNCVVSVVKLAPLGFMYIKCS